MKILSRLTTCVLTGLLGLVSGMASASQVAASVAPSPPRHDTPDVILDDQGCVNPANANLPRNLERSELDKKLSALLARIAAIEEEEGPNAAYEELDELIRSKGFADALISDNTLDQVGALLTASGTFAQLQAALVVTRLGARASCTLPKLVAALNDPKSMAVCPEGVFACSGPPPDSFFMAAIDAVRPDNDGFSTSLDGKTLFLWCPRQISVRQSLQSAQSGWRTSGTTTATQDAIAPSITRPKTNDTGSGGATGDYIQWTWQVSGLEPAALACNYENTSIQLLKPLPAGVERCMLRTWNSLSYFAWCDLKPK